MTPGMLSSVFFRLFVESRQRQSTGAKYRNIQDYYALHNIKCARMSFELGQSNTVFLHSTLLLLLPCHLVGRHIFLSLTLS